ncbi:MarR family winged helix-turn-helix transcriptional regulator [Pseudomonas sp. NPDC088444]|uniref:MarR family winged helix-turn-helix transcriptional regulator n=1 Tax=Pseudomonas sp. NPDC088444 TaxID=3364456 RepID=UPI00384FE97C
MKDTDEPYDRADLKLSEFLCFAVYSANLAFGKAYQPILDRLGLTYTQYITLIALGEEDNQTVSSLGEKLFLESNTLTPILKKLDAMGYVERHRDPQDERLVRVNLTKSGRELREGYPEAALSDAINLGDEEFRQIQQAVVRLRDNLVKHRKRND